VVITHGRLVSVAVDVEVMNAMLLPIVLGFLLVLEARALPPAARMRGWWRYSVWGLTGAVIVLGLYTAAALVGR